MFVNLLLCMLDVPTYTWSCDCSSAIEMGDQKANEAGRRIPGIYQSTGSHVVSACIIIACAGESVCKEGQRLSLD